MIIKCPKCSKVYKINISKLSKTHNSVKCKNCSYTFQLIDDENMMCPECGKIFGAETVFCPIDGNKLILALDLIPICSICKKLYFDQSKFCSDDGGKINSKYLDNLKDNTNKDKNLNGLIFEDKKKEIDLKNINIETNNGNVEESFHSETSNCQINSFIGKNDEKQSDKKKENNLKIDENINIVDETDITNGNQNKTVYMIELLEELHFNKFYKIVSSAYASFKLLFVLLISLFILNYYWELNLSYWILLVPVTLRIYFIYNKKHEYIPNESVKIIKIYHKDYTDKIVSGIFVYIIPFIIIVTSIILSINDLIWFSFIVTLIIAFIIAFIAKHEMGWGKCPYCENNLYIYVYHIKKEKIKCKYCSKCINLKIERNEKLIALYR